MPATETFNYLKQHITEYNCVKSGDLYTFTGDIPIGSATYKVASALFEVSPNLVASRIIEESGCDIVILLNIKENAVIFRKRNGCSLNLGKLAKSLSQGGGSEDIAGCILNDNIINITKLLC